MHLNNPGGSGNSPSLSRARSPSLYMYFSDSLDLHTLCPLSSPSRYRTRSRCRCLERCRSQARREQPQKNHDFCLKHGPGQGRNRALTVCFVPNSLDSGHAGNLRLRSVPREIRPQWLSRQRLPLTRRQNRPAHLRQKKVLQPPLNPFQGCAASFFFLWIRYWVAPK